DEAIEVGAQLIVTHHPLMLRGVTDVAVTNPKGAVVHRAVSHGIAMYNAHTNADAAAGGVADALAEAVGIKNPVPLIPVTPGSPEGTGRIGMLAGPTTLGEYAQQVAAALPATFHGVRVAGELDATVTTVAVVGGAGDSYIDAVRASGA